MARTYQAIIQDQHGPLKCFQVVVEPAGGKPPLIAQFGGIRLRRQKEVILVEEPPIEKRYERNELIKRLLADECELCGSTQHCEVQHIHKLADLKQAGRREKPFWVQMMAARRRKTLVVCRRCQVAIHAGRPMRERNRE